MTLPQSDPAGEELSEIFAKLNGSGAHACYCPRSVDGGCQCALKDEYLEEAKQKLRAWVLKQTLTELSFLRDVGVTGDANTLLFDTLMQRIAALQHQLDQAVVEGKS